MRSNLKLSVIIVNFNTENLTSDCINSVVKSNPGINYEIIIIDNGSEEKSKIKEQISKLQSKKQRARLIENKGNLGFAKAVNQGIKAAKGKFILLLNSDTLINRGSINRLVAFAQRTPGAGVVGARLLNPDGSVQPSCYHFPSVKNAIIAYWCDGKNLLDKYAPETISLVDAVIGGAFLITPKALSAVGLFDERYFMYFEDLDYCRRVWEKGLTVYYFPEAEVIHYHGASGKNLAKGSNQWRRLIPSSKIYHGLVKYYLIYFIMWSGQKWQKIFGR
jgi:GT2 family glycosyltransferase